MQAADMAKPLTETSLLPIKKAGIRAVGRYLGPESSWKALTKKETERISRCGLSLFSIWERSPTKPDYFTSQQAETDAQLAADYAQKVGQTPGTPIFFTVDYDAPSRDFPAIAQYLRIIHRTLTRHAVGVYGSFSIIETMRREKLADYYFQTYAWSKGRVSAGADLYQFKNDQRISGLTIDYDQIRNPAVLWKLRAATPFPGRLLRKGTTGPTVRLIQQKLQITADGLFGPQTERVVRHFQEQHRLQVDGIVGPMTWAELFKG